MYRYAKIILLLGGYIMKTLEKEIHRLKRQVKKLQSEIIAKNELIQEYERDWSLKLFNDLQTIGNEYSVLLSPPPVIIKSSYKNRGYAFQIELTDIIGLFSKGRSKSLLLKKPVPNLGSSEIITDIIYTEKNFPELLDQLDRSKFHFCQINRSCYVSLKYYNLTNSEVVTNEIRNKSFDRYSTLTILNRYKAEFISRKATYHHISLLQKNELHYILNFIINGLNSFTKN